MNGKNAGLYVPATSDQPEFYEFRERRAVAHVARRRVCKIIVIRHALTESNSLFPTTRYGLDDDDDGLAIILGRIRRANPKKSVCVSTCVCARMRVLGRAGTGESDTDTCFLTHSPTTHDAHNARHVRHAIFTAMEFRHVAAFSQRTVPQTLILLAPRSELPFQLLPSLRS